MIFYLAGQSNFGNRGCEALVRSIVSLVQTQCTDARFEVPALNRMEDAAQWPEMPAMGARFVEPEAVPAAIKWWNRVVSRMPALLPVWEPSYNPSAALQRAIDASSAVVMTGGDNISLDYGLGSLFYWSGLMDAAARRGRPTMLFAASVGPFQANSTIERYMVRHLRRYAAISVRESASLNYLHRLGLDSAVLAADPAFCLEPEEVDSGALFATASGGVLAFNLSPLVAASWQRRHPGRSLIEECAAFLRRVLDETELSVALLPHVDPLDGTADNSDSAYMATLLAALGGAKPRLALVDRGLNAVQTKYVIGRCRFLIAGRTHATIAGWSQRVPTVSIAYSVKARGLNQDLFGTLDYVLETPDIDRHSLWNAYQRLVDRESEIRSLLQERIPRWRANAAKSAAMLVGIAR